MSPLPPPVEIGFGWTANRPWEIEIGLFSRQCLGQQRIADLATLRRRAAAWNRRVNREQVKIDWRFDRKKARRTFGYKRPSIRRSEN